MTALTMPTPSRQTPARIVAGKREAKIHTSCAVVSAPTLVRAFARWCFTVERDRPRRWAAAFSEPAARLGSRWGSDQRAVVR
jgi:hypothetical protein